MMRFADLIAGRAEEIAAVEVRDNGKLYKEMVAQLRVIPEWLYYFGGLADKAEGRTIPLDRTSVLNYALREPVRRLQGERLRPRQRRRGDRRLPADEEVWVELSDEFPIPS